MMNPVQESKRSTPNNVPAGNSSRAAMGRKRTSQRPRMVDVGQRAGVSACTVSRAFSAPETVRPEILERVMRAADELNYSVNSAAKALRLQTTHIFGVLIPTLEYDLFAKLVSSFQSTLSSSGYAPVVVTTGFDNARLFEHVETIVARGAEGLLVVGKIQDEKVRRFLERTHLPIVATYSFVEDMAPSIGFDNYQSAQQAIDYLLSLGHRHLAMLAGPTQGNDRQQSRIQAFHDAQAAHEPGVEWPVIQHAYDNAYAAGAQSLRDLLAQHPQTTAIICNSDTFAIGALLEAQRLGVRVPQDLSIIGHDDLELAALLNPALSTVAVPAREMGRRCAQALLNAKRYGAAIQPYRLDASLIIRGSTGPAPRRDNPDPDPTRSHQSQENP